MFATFSPKFNEQNPTSANFKIFLSNTDITALQAQVESIYKVNFIFSGLEFDYDVVLSGSVRELGKAVNFIAPKGRSDLLIGRSSF